MDEKTNRFFFNIVFKDFLDSIYSRQDRMSKDYGEETSKFAMSVVCPLLFKEFKFVYRRGFCGTKQWNNLVDRINAAYNDFEYNNYFAGYEEWLDERNRIMHRNS